MAICRPGKAPVAAREHAFRYPKGRLIGLFFFRSALNELRFSLKLLLMERKLKRDARMIKASVWSGALALAALISLPLQAAEPVKVGSKIDPGGARGDNRR